MRIQTCRDSGKEHCTESTTEAVANYLEISTSKWGPVAPGEPGQLQVLGRTDSFPVDNGYIRAEPKIVIATALNVENLVLVETSAIFCHVSKHLVPTLRL